MTGLELIIANKKYSSWSLRPWLAMKVFDVPFKETTALFDHAPADPAEWNAHFSKFSPTGKVPVLKHGDLTVWDSLAILDYLADLFPEKNWRPPSRAGAALARALCCEMHAGFSALRDECPMNMARPVGAIAISDACRKDIARIETIWRDCLDASGGPFLFGDFTTTDAVFAPVVNRFEKYALSNCDAAAQYGAAIKSLPAWREWEASGATEPWTCDVVEI